MKKLPHTLLLTVLLMFMLSAFLYPLDQSKVKWNDIIPWLIAVAALFFALYQYVRRKKDKEKEVNVELETRDKFEYKKEIQTSGTAKERYRAVLKKELGYIDLLGSPDIENKTVKLEDAFVSLCISESWRSDERFDSDVIKNKRMMAAAGDRHLSPEEVMKRAFQKHRLLLVIGDPGSGKTTLLKYYAMGCLDKTKCKKFGLTFKGGILPVYFPLRELEFNTGGKPVPLPDNLVQWSDSHVLDIPSQQFLKWLRGGPTLVLLDGLDEISDIDQRKAVCSWIRGLVNGLDRAYFVVTSRATGYRKLDGIELGIPHLRADIMDFSPQQQALFLKKWFRAVCLAELPPVGMDIPGQEWKERQGIQAVQRSRAIIEFLNKQDNKAVQDLAAVPMLLQIMAILWKDRRHLPESRSELYGAALNYLLDYRDRQRNLNPLLRAEKALPVLTGAGLWMQEILKKDEVSKKDMHGYMQPILNTLSERPAASAFCANLRDRAGLIAEYKDYYIFRHKSFREFLAGLQLIKESRQPQRIDNVAAYFNEDWWEETLRFFMSQADDQIFDEFMRSLFRSPESRRLNGNKQTLLKHLVIEAPQKKIDALVEGLNSAGLNANQKRYVIDCLKTIGTPEALEAIKKADRSKMEKSTISYAEDIIAEESLIEIPRQKDLETLSSFRNPFEDNVEYIKIPGGAYKYSVTKKKETVLPLYLCKYPVTNKRYRRFISFLEGNEKNLLKKIPPDMFGEKLLKFAGSIKRYDDYLGTNFKEWAGKFRSRFDDDKKFKGDDQPVVGVTWYAARAYCFWLSCLEAAQKEDEKLENIDAGRIASIYRLPTEIEWEWAAGGEPDGSVREYPWPKDKGDPNPELANYGKNVGATTPVNRYPEGATPAELMDMAGNVWEWMENYYDEDEDSFALRGGSWGADSAWLRCSARYLNIPGLSLYIYAGFRVAFPQS